MSTRQFSARLYRDGALVGEVEGTLKDVRGLRRCVTGRFRLPPSVKALEAVLGDSVFRLALDDGRMFGADFIASDHDVVTFLSIGPISR